MPERDSHGKFVSNLRKLRDDTLRGMQRFKLQIAMQAVAGIQDNIRDNFGADKSGRSDITRWASGGTARSSGRSGALRDSVKLEEHGDDLVVNVGGAGAPYAEIHEYGGVITPKNSKYLTIPAARYVGKRARELDVVFGIDPQWGKVLYDRGTTNVAFLLRSRVTIPERPYIRPAIEKINEENGIRLALARSFTSPEVVIK